MFHTFQKAGHILEGYSQPVMSMCRDKGSRLVHDKFAKYLQGFGFRIQKSAFEAMISRKKYRKLLDGISEYVTKEDSVKVYKIIGKGQVTSFGKKTNIDDEEIILI